MSKYIPILILLLSTNLFAQPRMQWVKSYRPNGYAFASLSDVFHSSDGGFALCGSTFPYESHHIDAYIIKTDQTGDPQWTIQIGDNDNLFNGSSIIETDDTGFLTVGNGFGQPCDAGAWKLNAEGDIEWSGQYGGDDGDGFSAAIELKSGEFVICGMSQSFGNDDQGYIVMLESDGDLLWERDYGGARDQTLRAMRETEGGIVCVGASNRDAWSLKIDFNGDVIWEHTYESDNDMGFFPYEYGTGLVSCPGGFVIGAYALQYFWALKINAEGDRVWDFINTYPLNNFNNEITYRCRGITRTNDNNFVLVGCKAYVNGGGWIATAMKCDQVGNPVWSSVFTEVYEMGDTLHPYMLSSVITLPDGSIVAAGSCLSDTSFHDEYGLLFKMLPERSAPEIIAQYPAETDLTVLRGEEVFFDVDVIDLQHDSISYEWRLDDEWVSADTSLHLTFDETGIYQLGCFVFDEDQSDSAFWNITVTDIYVASYSPDSLNLTLKRGQTVISLSTSLMPASNRCNIFGPRPILSISRRNFRAIPLLPGYPSIDRVFSPSKGWAIASRCSVR